MSDVLNEALKAVSKYDQLIAAAREVAPPRTVVVHPCDETSLRGAVEGAEAGLIDPVLVGPAARIRAVATQTRIDLDGCEIVDAAHSHAAAAQAVALVREGKGELLMKGSLHTDELMKEVTCSATGLRTERRISRPRGSAPWRRRPVSTSTAARLSTPPIAMLPPPKPSRSSARARASC